MRNLGLGFRVSGSGCRVQGLEFRVWGLGIMDWFRTPNPNPLNPSPYTRQKGENQNVQRFRGRLVLKAHRLRVSLNSRLDSNEEEEEKDNQNSIRSRKAETSRAGSSPVAPDGPRFRV